MCRYTQYVYACNSHIYVSPQEGLTALMVAAKEGQTAIVNTLVEGHADINIQENVSRTRVSCLVDCTLHV